MDYKFTINYPRSYGLIPTDNPEKFIATREKNGMYQPVNVQVIQSEPYIDDNVEIVDIKVITTILAGAEQNNP